MRSLFVLFLILISCSHKNPKDSETKNNPDEKIEIKSRPYINVKNQKFHLKVNGKTHLEKKVNVYGSYTHDRFKENNRAVFLDGVSDYIKIDNHPNVNSTNELTISIWYKPDSYKGVGQNVIICKSFNEYKTPYYQYLLSATGNLYPSSPAIFKFGLSIDGKFNQIQTKSNTWSPSNWYNIIGSYDGEIMSLYVNGDLQSHRDIHGKIDLYHTPVLIGKTPYKELYTSGTYDDFRLFDRALTTNEIKILSSEN